MGRVGVVWLIDGAVFHVAAKSSVKEMTEMEHIVGSPVWGFVLYF